MILTLCVACAPAAGLAQSPAPATTRPVQATPPHPPPVACDPLCDPRPTSAPAGPRFWGEASYLGWWATGSPVPALVSASPAGTPIGQAGVLGTPGAAVLFGDRRVNTGMLSGLRVRAGFWCDDDQTHGIEGSFLYLAGASTGFLADGNAQPVLARPFVNALTGLSASERVAFPNDLAGTVRASVGTDPLYGAGLHYRCLLCRDCDSRLDFVGGFRFLSFGDQVAVNENLTTLPGNAAGVPAGVGFALNDEFRARNRFYGGDLGLAGTVTRGSWDLVGRASVALGSTRQSASVSGFTRVTDPAGAVLLAAPGGLLAQSTNIGSVDRDVFTVVPEVSIQVRCRVTSRVSVTAGYTALYWSDVARAGTLIDPAVNPNLLPGSPVTGGPARPAFRFPHSDVWFHGFDAGLAFAF